MCVISVIMSIMLINTLMCIMCIIQFNVINVISVIMSIMPINTLINTMRIIATYLRDRDRRRVMSAAVFPGSLAIKLVPTQKYICNIYQLL